MANNINNIKIGFNDINKIYLGSNKINKIYLGNTLIFSNTGSSSGGNNTNTVIGSTYLTLGNRTVGYVQDITGTTSNNAIIVSTASALSSAISNAKAGTTIYVKGGTYTVSDGLTISNSGSSGNPIVIKNYPEETPILTGTQVSISSGTKYVTFEGFKIQDLTQLDWDTCLSVGSGCSYITLRNLEITNIKSVTADNGCNPLVLYGDGSTPISNCLIENCYVHDCHTGWSEAITLNGNVTDCIVRNCCIDNTMNIGIDLAGNFSWTGTVGDANNQARNILVENNLVMNCQSPYATSAGLYCDGGRDNTFRYNVVYNCQCGIELGAEESGATVQNFHVYGNLIVDSGRSIGVGGYQSTSATHQNTWIYNNTIICGTSNEENYGLYLERTKNLYFVNNIVYGASGTELYTTSGNASNITLNGNCWYNGTKPSADSTGITSDPLFKNNNGSWTGNYNLQLTSPCINKGQTVSDMTLCGTTDINGNARANNTIDIGAFEYYDGSSSGGGNTGGGDTGGTGGSSSTNIIPLFSTWQQETGLSVSSISDYDIVFTAPSAWTGIYLWGSTIINNGQNITIGVSSISSNAEFAIMDANGTAVAVVTSSQLSQSVTVNGTSPFDIYITSSDTNQVTVVGAYIYIN